MEDILSALDDVAVGKTSTKAESKVKSAPKETAIKMGRIDYKNLKEVLKSKNLYAVFFPSPQIAFISCGTEKKRPLCRCPTRPHNEFIILGVAVYFSKM